MVNPFWYLVWGATASGLYLLAAVIYSYPQISVTALSAISAAAAMAVCLFKRIAAKSGPR
jgi:hypothetical protein